MNTTSHPDFKLLRSKQIPSLGLDASEYKHAATGATHIHLAALHEENVFLIALRTMPENSSGAAHILEHTALCGSRHFPVHDPFFMMLKRSLNTFMNALTSSDWTAYPFASCNRKDFDNLLQVYLDAVFFPQLDPLDFAREGHRLEFQNPGDPDSPLEYKGIVYNEMKGSMSSPVNMLWHKLSKHLYPTTTYGYNSGGDPEHIPELSHRQLVAFHRTHYHPSNALFFTFGNISASEHQQRFVDLALCHFKGSSGKGLSVPDEQRLSAPQRVSEPYPASADEGKTHIVCAWLLGRNTCLEELLEAQLMTYILLDNSASPLYQALETSPLGAAPSPLCGLEDDQREICFVCGLEDSSPEHADALEELIINTLQAISAQGIETEMVEAALHQIELRYREIGGDGYPYGLKLIFSCLPQAIHYGDALGALEVDAALNHLRAACKDPAYLPALIRKWLLDNPHRVRLCMYPDTEMSKRLQARERARLDTQKKELSANEAQTIIDITRKLEDKQQQTQDPSALPGLELKDIAAKAPSPIGKEQNLGGMRASCFAAPVNGLVYQNLVVEMPQFDATQLKLLPLYLQGLSELGAAQQDYLAMQRRQALFCGSFAAGMSIGRKTCAAEELSALLSLTSNALQRNAEAQCVLMRDVLNEARFDELERLSDLVHQNLAASERSITNTGHLLAALAAESHLSPVAELHHRLEGLASVALWRELKQQLASAGNTVSQSLASMHQLIKALPKKLLLIADHDFLPRYQELCAKVWAEQQCSDKVSPLDLAASKSPAQQIWLLPQTQINFCARVWPTVGSAHEDAPGLSVLAELMRNIHLHKAIRETGGAYGAGASQNNAAATFRCFSYRDPRLAETLEDFDRAAGLVSEGRFNDEELKEAILGVIAKLDKPASPAGTARRSYYDTLKGWDEARRSWYRSEIIGADKSRLKNLAARYLKPELASVAVITQDVATAKSALPDADLFQI